MNRHDYYKFQAWVAGSLLTLVLALNRLEIIDLEMATLVAIPVMAYLIITVILSYRFLKEADDTRDKDAEIARIKSDAGVEKARIAAKLEKKLAKEKAKTEKKKIEA